MKDYSFLRPGLRWARPRLNSYEKTPYAWCIVETEGYFPFLRTTVVLEMPGLTKSLTTIVNPDDWEFGPELNVPDKNYVEILAGKGEELVERKR